MSESLQKLVEAVYEPAQATPEVPSIAIRALVQDEVRKSLEPTNDLLKQLLAKMDDRA